VKERYGPFLNFDSLTIDFSMMMGLPCYNHFTVLLQCTAHHLLPVSFLEEIVVILLAPKNMAGTRTCAHVRPHFIYISC
jgi:hypothetical protein